MSKSLLSVLNSSVLYSLSCMAKISNSNPKTKDYYSGYNYVGYWDNRDYEHAAEEMAIRRLLKGKHFKKAADIGGAYGRLCPLLTEYADNVTLAEPSKTQLDEAQNYLRDYPKVQQRQMQANDLKFEDVELDLVTMIRVMHHLPDPSREFNELARVLKNDGTLILEVANYSHFRNRLKHLLKLQKIPEQPVDIRTKKGDTIAFVNHNPRTVIKKLAHAGLKVDKTLSVSNLRSPLLKKIIPLKLLLAKEWLAQPLLAKIYFGPSIFFLVKKAK